MLPERWTPTKRDWLIFLALAAALVSIRVFLIVTSQWNDLGDLPESGVGANGQDLDGGVEDRRDAAFGVGAALGHGGPS